MDDKTTDDRDEAEVEPEAKRDEDLEMDAEQAEDVKGGWMQPPSMGQMPRP